MDNGYYWFQVYLPAGFSSCVGEGSCGDTDSSGDEGEEEEEEEEEGETGELAEVDAVEFGFNGEERFVVFSFSEKIFIVL